MEQEQAKVQEQVLAKVQQVLAKVQEQVQACELEMTREQKINYVMYK